MVGQALTNNPVAPVCQRDTADSTATTSTTSSSTTSLACPRDWERFEGNCYRLFESSSNAFDTWFEAEAKCMIEGATLTSVHSQEEDNFLKDLSNGNSYWIGAYPKESSWIWSDFTEFDFTNFYTVTSRMCLYQDSSYYSNGWSSAPCAASYPSIQCICKLFLNLN